MRARVSTLLLVALLAACSRAPAPAEAPAATGNSSTDIYAEAIASVGRTDADRARDANRKPAEVLSFLGIEPGMVVLDMFSGGGYYTEILSNVVGSDGKVVAHNNAVYVQFVGEEATNRYRDERLPNVELLMAENNELALPADTFDAIMMVLAYHDIYYIDPDNGWPEIDGQKLIAEFRAGLKPGGILAIVDHAAAAGSPRETGNTLHRIDPDIVVSELTKAGFVLDGTSDVLRNTTDDLSLNMADPSIRGRTDRFVMRFRKPE
ncbi:MAG: methyltransferase domain-containing protein [Gammaproteobacteria bacterium]|nr:methyltransferase domain-containing protein [Gammaproteobacteria bacterium]